MTDIPRDFPLDLARSLGIRRGPAAASSAPITQAMRNVFSASTWEGVQIPERCFLVPGLIPSRTVTMLGGDGGTGKSLLALQLAAAVSTRTEWLGMSVATGPVVFISAEDDATELHRRAVDVARAADISLADLEQLQLCSLAGEDALLATLNRDGTLEPTPKFEALDELLADTKPALLALDTLADLFPGNENDRAQARQFIGLLRGLAIRHRCAVLLLSHPSLTGISSGTGTSGSTGWNNSVRSRLYLRRVVQDGYEANPDARVLETMKANYGRTGGGISMTWRDGVFVADEPETGLDRMASTAKAERVFLSLLRQMQYQGRKVNPSGGQTYAPKVFTNSPDAEGISKRGFSQAMERLLSAGKIRVATDGSPSKRRSYLEVVE